MCLMNIFTEDIISPVGDCAAGHWCTFGIDRQYPSETNLTALVNNTCYDGRTLGYGGLCPVGYYCPGGVASVHPVPCDNGTYADEEGLSQCKTCVEGRCLCAWSLVSCDLASVWVFKAPVSVSVSVCHSLFLFMDVWVCFTSSSQTSSLCLPLLFHSRLHPSCSSINPLYPFLFPSHTPSLNRLLYLPLYFSPSIPLPPLPLSHVPPPSTFSSFNSSHPSVLPICPSHSLSSVLQSSNSPLC